MRNFKKLMIWQKAMDIVELTYKITAAFPEFEKYSLTNQCQRSAVSIASNIAEGSSRTSTKDQKRFMEISLGSLYELETQMRISVRLGYLKGETMRDVEDMIEDEQKMLCSFINILNNKILDDRNKFKGKKKS